MLHSMTYIDLRHDFLRVCLFITANAILANFLPNAQRFNEHPKLCYLYVQFVDIVAGFGCNWRYKLPSLDLEFMGFRIIRSKLHNQDIVIEEITMLTKFKLWLASKNNTTHSIAAAYVALAAFYATNDEGRQYINSTASDVYQSLPHWLAAFITSFAIPLYIWYRSGQSQPGRAAAAVATALSTQSQDKAAVVAASAALTAEVDKASTTK